MKKITYPPPGFDESLPEFPGGIGSPDIPGHGHRPKPYIRLLKSSRLEL